MNKKIFKRLLAGVIIIAILIWNVIKTPAILPPVLGLGGIILFGAGLCFLLNRKDKLDRKGTVNYGKIPAVVIIIASVASAIVVGHMVSIPLAIFAVVVGLILAILFYYRGKRKAKSNIINFKTRKGVHKGKFKNNPFVRKIDSFMDSFLKEFFPDAKTRNIAKVVISIILVAVILVFIIPNIMEIIVGAITLILAIYLIGIMGKRKE